MSATYELPLATDVHRLRFRVGDTDVTAALLQDEEYDELLIDAGDDLALGEAYAYSRLAAKFARMVDTTEGDVSVKASQRAERYAALAASALDQIATGGAGAPVAPPYAGGVSVADIAAREANTDRPPNAFGGPRPPYGYPSWWPRRWPY